MHVPAAAIAAHRLHHRRTWGAEPDRAGAWRFAIWAPSAERVSVEVAGRRVALAQAADGFHRGTARAAAGEAYLFLVDGRAVPDPAARAQSGDVHAPSLLVDPSAHGWTVPWNGRPWHEAVICELHLGTFTPEGTFAAAAARLPELAALGFTAVELMPVGQFPGQRGWGYDGVLPFAPHPAYGTPDDMKRFVESAQALGLMVILDVIWNHFGPDGAYLHAVSPEFFDQTRHTPWGAGVDYTQPAVRDFYIDNALMWLTEYRLDGLRLDAVHQIADPSDPWLVEEIARRVRAMPMGRPIHLIAEDERNLATWRDPDRACLTAAWNDDWHHAMHCLLTGESEGYYAPFAVDPMADLCTALADGQVDQGQPRTGAPPRGEPSGHLPWTAFVNANQTHDQIGNRAHGERLMALADPAGLEIAHAMLLCGPFIPMLFMGEEAGADSPFLFFCDHQGDLARLTREGRQREFVGFAGFAGDVPDPNDPVTFETSRPATSDPDRAARWRELTRRLLALRAERIVPLMRSGRSGPARVARTGPRSVSAEWPFAAGTLAIRANLGRPPDVLAEGQAGAEHPDLVLNDPATDVFAFAVTVRR